MEINGININKYNTENKRHGYWNLYYGKGNYYNGESIGYYHNNDKNYWQCHKVKDAKFGCERLHNEQCFYNKDHKLFGEHIRWK